jgi:hypothetical protein
MKLLSALTALISVVVLSGAAADATDTALREATDAWDRGEYVTALTTYLRLLDSPAADRVLEPIALQTGELFRTTELTRDGGSPRFSPDGQHILYEAGADALRTTRVVRLDAAGSFATVATLEGHSARFSADGSTLVYLKVPPSQELVGLQAAADRATGTDRALRSNELAEFVARVARLVVRDVATGRETEIDTGTVRKSLPVAGAGGSILFVGWAAEGEADQMYLVSAGAAPRPLTTDSADKTIVAVNASGSAVLFTPRRRGGQGGPATFGVISLPEGNVMTVAGSAPAFSGDGGTLAYVSLEGDEHRLAVARLGMLDRATVVRSGPERLDSPALSRDGGSLVFQMMPREDWEVFLHHRDGSREVRVTREIQHDVLPRFLTSERLLGAIGEPRHRRSYLYDLPSLKRTRLFHNNTVRTLAPEYAWVPNPAGTQILIVAERDGDTVSPERGVYLVDLTQRVTRGVLRARVAANLQAEQTLRANATRIYAPIADAVRAVVNRASTGRVLEYQKALFGFDSKHITSAGNQLAARYLFESYKAFGYEPEYQWFAPRNAAGGQTANVLATLPGTANPELIYVVSSHYDSVAAGPGADDNSSGTAALLEAARILKDHPQPATIVFASFTGEESGLLGSREYVRRAIADTRQIVGALNNDMIGWANDHRLDATIRYSNSGIRDVQHAAAIQFTNLITYDALYYKSTDAAAYYEAFGDIVGGIGSYPILGNPHYHQAHDVLETINHQLVTEVARTTAASIMLLASSPSRLKGLKVDRVADGAATVSWTPSPEKGVTTYLVTWGPPTNPAAQQMRVTTPAVPIKGATAGTVVSVKAVNAKGLEGWDWARITID